MFYIKPEMIMLFWGSVEYLRGRRESLAGQYGGSELVILTAKNGLRNGCSIKRS